MNITAVEQNVLAYAVARVLAVEEFDAEEADEQVLYKCLVALEEKLTAN